MSRWKKRALAALGAATIIAMTTYVFRYSLGAAMMEAAIGDFDAAKAPPAPDYALESSWAALPTKDDASDRTPKDLVEPESPTRDLVDVFYIHPTGFNGRDNWNGPMGDQKDFAIPTSIMLAGQASAFNGCGRVYAPEYRQASIFAFIGPMVAPQKSDAFQALDLAYSDVARAFDYFIDHYSEGRPFIIASHSQGTTHALRLLAEKIDGTPLYPRLIAAYVIGYNVPKDYFSRVYKNIVPCNSPTQPGCLIAWDTVREGLWLPQFGFHRYPSGWELATGKERFSVNPLTWTTSEARAPAKANDGALLASMVPFSVNPDRCEIKGISHEHTWAQCHAGRLWIAPQNEGAFYDRIGVYHLFDYNLFWMNIRENARARAEAYLRAHGQLPRV